MLKKKIQNVTICLKGSSVLTDKTMSENDLVSSVSVLTNLLAFQHIFIWFEVDYFRVSF